MLVFVRHLPTNPLAPPNDQRRLDPIDGCWETAARAQSVLIIPDGCIDIIERAEQLYVVGPMTRAITVDLRAAPSRGIRFRPAQVRSWLRVDAHEFVDQRIGAEAVAALRGARTLSDVVDMARSATAPMRMHQAVRRLISAPNTRISNIASELGLSVRQLHRDFLREVGLSPKAFARIQRLQQLRQILNAPEASRSKRPHLAGQQTRARSLAAYRRPTQQPSLATLACEAGYADQAHMNRDVRELCGVTPGQFVALMSDSYNTDKTAAVTL